MKTLHDETVRVNSGAAWEMKKGERVRITFQSIVDFVVFKELFDPIPHIDLRAEMNCLCAASCDPGSGKLGSSKGFHPKPIRIQVFDE